MEPQWWTIVVRAFSHENTDSGLVIRLTRSDNHDTDVRVCGSVVSAVEQIESWLTALSERTMPLEWPAPDDPADPADPANEDDNATRRLRRPDDGSTSTS